MIRDKEIERLINYAKGLGLKVTLSSKKDDSAAEWTLDNTEIRVFTRNNDTKVDIVLSLIHELGHALHNIHEKDRKIDPKVDEAVDHQIESKKFKKDVPKKQRKVILEHEIAGAAYWEVIYKDTNMKFPMWRLYAQRDFDIWQYEVYHETGELPIKKDRMEKFKQLKEKYRG